MNAVSVAEIVVGDPVAAWQEAGFAVGEDGVCRIDSIAFRLVGAEDGTGIRGWSLTGIADDLADVDGIATTTASVSTPEPAPAHPNGVVGVDHLVLLSPYLERTRGALAGIGLEPRRERDGSLAGAPMRQVFYRFDNVILEVVGSPDAEGDGPSQLWGVTFVVEDIDASAALLGERTGAVKDAVQPGRRITTLRNRQIGMSVNTALITPHVR